jgi:hypothetical protein
MFPPAMAAVTLQLFPPGQWFEKDERFAPLDLLVSLANAGETPMPLDAAWMRRTC